MQLTRFIGREREVAELRRLLRPNRLLTLTGAGGSGKTRVALEVTAQVAADFPDGTVWVDLAPLSDPTLVPQQVVAALGVRDEGARPTVEGLVEALRERSLLLVLDNCEHLVGACALLAEALLRRCAGLHILATSREALGISGEQAWLLPPLSIPDASAAADAVARAEAARLFVDRARAALPSFELTPDNAEAVAQICRRLDGLPLAIELAAARVRVLAPAQIAERLDDVFRLLTAGERTALPRHRTLRETMDWSHALLSEREQTLLRRLSVFAGGFSLDAVEAVCEGGALEADAILDLLSGLVNKSLVAMDAGSRQARYRLLEAVRQYGEERLRAAGEAELLRTCHAEYFLALAEAAEPNLFGGAADAAWMARLDAELANLRAAADWFERNAGGVEGALRLAAALHWYWFARGYFRVGRRRLTAALARADAAAPAVRAKALAALGNVVFWQGDYPAMGAPLAQSVAILRETGPRDLLAYALVGLGAATSLGGDDAAAGPILDEAVAIARTVRPRVLTTFALYWHGHAAQARGELDVAASSFEEAVAIGRAEAHGPATAHAVTARALLAYRQGDHTTAIAGFGEALALHGRSGDRWGVVQVLEGLASIAAAEGRLDRAARLLGASHSLCEAMGTLLSGEVRDHHTRLVASVRERLGDDAFAAAWAEVRTLAYEQVLELGRAPHAAAAAAASAPAASPAAASAAVPAATAGTPAPAPVAPVTAPAGNGARPPTAPAPALRVRALGPLEIHLDGARLSPDAWSYAKPRELLLYLLCHPEGGTREQIARAFWPDATPPQSKNSFHVTLHHLRKALGRPEWVLFEDERYRIDSEPGCELDTDLFEAELAGALADARVDDDSIDRLEAALSLYRGDFLEGENAGAWHLEPRDRLLARYAEGMLTLGDLLSRAGRWRDAARAYHQLILKEDLREEAHRGLMLCYARTGERARALRHYERLVELLRDELDAEPEPETTALFDRLRQAQPV